MIVVAINKSNASRTQENSAIKIKLVGLCMCKIVSIFTIKLSEWTLNRTNRNI